jgi:hygromycin-B 7''-O-kinase
LFGGERSFPVERAVAELLREHPVMPVPRLLGEGALDPPGAAWHWPYLIYEFIQGTSFGEVIDQIEPADRLRVARQVGGWVRALHSLPIPPGGPFPADFHFHLSFLEAQRSGSVERHRTWGTLPERLLPEIEGYLLPTDALLLPGERPHIIHADLTADHLLGRLDGGCWTSLAMIDFGDAITGGLFYELAALHFGLFACDRVLLEAFLAAYGYNGPTGADFARRAMTCSLLFEFNLLNGLADYLDLLQAGSLEQIGERIWLI